MKFLQHGDSVVSLRFRFQEILDRYESTESRELVELPTDTTQALAKIAEAEAILNQQATGDTDVEFGDKEWGDTSALLAIINNSLDGDLGLLPSSDLDLYYRMQARLREAESSGEIPGVYLYGDGQQAAPPVDELLPGFGESEELSFDLTGFSKERVSLLSEVAQVAEHTEAGATSVLDRMALLEELRATTEAGLKREIERTPSPDRPAVAIASTVRELPQDLGAALASLDKETARQFGLSAMNGFNPDQFA